MSDTTVRHTTRAAILAAVLAGAMLVGQQAAAQAGAAVRAGAKEAAEAVGRRAAAEGAEISARELAELGGEAAVRETIERAVAEGGEAAAGRVARLVDAMGPDALRALRNAGPGETPALLAAIEGMSADLAPAAVRALARSGEGPALAALAARFGPEALETAARHPGVGTALYSRLGSDGAALGRTLSTDQAIAVMRHADDLAALPAADRAGVVRLLTRSPAQTVSFLEKHPKFLAIAGAGAILALHADQIFEGTAEVVIGPDGKPILVQRAGFLERAVLQPALRWVLPVIAALLALWGGVKLFWLWRRERAASPSA